MGRGVKVLTGIVVVGAVAGGGAWAAKGPLTNGICEQIEKFSGEKLDSDHCIKVVAIQLRDPAMCERITGERFKAKIDGKEIQLENPPKMQCLTDIAVATNNPALCEGVEGVLIAATKIDCLYSVAVRYHNPTACDGIGDSSQSRSGMLMNAAGCRKMAGVPAAPPAANEGDAEDACVAGGGNYAKQSKQCSCPEGSASRGSASAPQCACEIKATGILHALFGFGSSTWHALRPGETCDWWKGIGGLGENLGKERRQCYDGGGVNYDNTESACTCPSGSSWKEELNACVCADGGGKPSGKTQLRQGENCFGG